MREQPNYLVTFLDQREAIRKEGEDQQEIHPEKILETEDDESPFLIKQKKYPCIYLII